MASCQAFVTRPRDRYNNLGLTLFMDLASSSRIVRYARDFLLGLGIVLISAAFIYDLRLFIKSCDTSASEDIVNVNIYATRLHLFFIMTLMSTYFLVD